MLIIYGEYDWIMSKEDHEEIAQVVNTNNPGKAELFIIPKISHMFGIHPSLKEAFNGTNEKYASQVSDIIINWLSKQNPKGCSQLH